MNTSSLIARVGLEREDEITNLVRPADFGAMKAAATMGGITLAHFTAQLLLAEFVVLNWIIPFAVNACFGFTLPVDLTLSRTPASWILSSLTQPVRSFPLPDWVWANGLTALLLAALNSAIWGICLGALVRAVWKGLRFPRKLAAKSERELAG